MCSPYDVHLQSQRQKLQALTLHALSLNSCPRSSPPCWTTSTKQQSPIPNILVILFPAHSHFCCAFHVCPTVSQFPARNTVQSSIPELNCKWTTEPAETPPPTERAAPVPTTNRSHNNGVESALAALARMALQRAKTRLFGSSLHEPLPTNTAVSPLPLSQPHLPRPPSASRSPAPVFGIDQEEQFQGNGQFRTSRAVL